MEKRNNTYLLSIKAEDRPGLLHFILGIINRKLIPVTSITAAPSDIQSNVLINLEVVASEKAIEPLVLKIENIIEVFSVRAHSLHLAVTERCAFYKLRKSILTSSKIELLRKWDLKLISQAGNILIFSKSANDVVLRRIYNELEGPDMIGFVQSGIISDGMFIDDESESSVINRLAA